MTKTLICKICGKGRDVGSRKCTDCRKEANRVRAKKRFLEKGRTMYDKNCVACKNPYRAWRKQSVLCPTCYKQSRMPAGELASNNYVYKRYAKYDYAHEHRRIVETYLGRILTTNEVIHHVDGNTKNNDPSNLIVLTRSAHGKLHQYLNLQRVIWQKCQNENHENCWNSLIAPLTTAWLETTGAKVLRIMGIGKSAAEPLSNEEGSETMHVTPNQETEGDDIVQTTT